MAGRARIFQLYRPNSYRAFCSFLDASEAFNRLVHSGLFVKLMERNELKAFLVMVTFNSFDEPLRRDEVVGTKTAGRKQRDELGRMKSAGQNFQ